MNNKKDPKNFWFKIPGEENLEASITGEIRKIYKHKTKVLTPYLPKRKLNLGYYVHVNYKMLKVSHLVYKTFYGDIKDGMCIMHKDGCLWNNHKDNLLAVTKKELGKITGKKSKSIRVKKIDSKGKTIETYYSAREAARNNYVSYQTVLDRCNYKVKREFFSMNYTFRFDE